jgi:hypothetical protein
MFSVAVKIDDFEKRRRSTTLLHLAIGFFILIKASDYYKLTQYKQFFPVAILLLIASFSLFYGLFRKKLDLSGRRNFQLRLVQFIAYLILGILFANKSSSFDSVACFLFSAFCLMLFFTEKKIFNDTVIYLKEEGIVIPGYYKEHIVSWEDLTEVVVREDFITLFHVKQKYLQYQVMQDLSALETAKMNAFCKEKIGEKTIPREA